MTCLRHVHSLIKLCRVSRLRLSSCKYYVRLRQASVHQGFTLLELVISIAIAAIISLSLTMLLNQSYASQTKLESLTQLNERATLFFTQLERDLMGATIPIENILALEAEQEKKSKNKKDDAAQAPKKENGEKNNQTAAQDSKKEEPAYKPFDRVFYYNRGAQNRFFFSWVTRNPLQLHWGSSVGAARPRIARVMYRLEQDATDKTLFKLIRSEGLDLTYAPYEKHADPKYKGSAIIDGVKSIKVTCVAVIEKKDEQKDAAKVPLANAAGQQKKEEKPPVTEVKVLDHWEWPLSKDDKQKDDKKSEELPPLPQGVRVELVLWDATHEREVTFAYGIYIPALPTLHREKKDEKKAPEQAQKKPGEDKKPDGTIDIPGGGGRMPVGGGSKPKDSHTAYAYDPNTRKMVRIPS